jgi:hypothetical protein
MTILPGLEEKVMSLVRSCKLKPVLNIERPWRQRLKLQYFSVLSRFTFEIKLTPLHILGSVRLKWCRGEINAHHVKRLEARCAIQNT